MALQQQRCEQLDQTLSAEDTALLEQEGVLEPAIPQPSSIRGEAVAVVKVGEGLVGEKERLFFREGHPQIVIDSLIIRKKLDSLQD